MLPFIFSRVASGLLLLLALSMLIFSLLHLMPGSPVESLLGELATPEDIAALEAELNLDQPIWTQYIQWVTDALQGDFGASIRNGYDITEALEQKLPVTLAVSFGGIFLSILIGIPCGVAAALHHSSPLDWVITLFVSVNMAVPAFWLAMILAVWLGVYNNWFPVMAYTAPDENILEWLYSLALPCMALGIAQSAVITRQMRISMLNVLQEDYIVAAYASGITPSRIIWQYALKNAILPVLTIIGFRLAMAIGGGIIVEQVFALPGIGTMMVGAVLSQDIPVVQAVVMVTAVFVVVVNLLVDIVYEWLNPKVRLQ